MNKQTKSYRKLGISTKVVKGTNGIQTKSFDKIEGKPCITCFKCKDKNPQNKRRSHWKGCMRNTAVYKILEQAD